MHKKPYPSETQERFIVRLPDGMRDMIADAAKLGNRSMNSEVVRRLEASFESSNAVSPTVLQSIQDAAAEWGTSFDEALERAVLSGVSPNAPQVLIIRPTGNMTVAEMRKLFEAGKGHISPDANVIFEKG